MKKFTLIALALLMTLGASAQRKTWDFRKGFSSTTIDALQASFEAGKTWTDYETTAGEGTGKYYVNRNGVVSGTACTYDADGNATPIPEFEGLNFSSIKKKGFVICYNYGQIEDAESPNGYYTYGTSFLWFNGKNMSFTFRAKAGETLKCGIESHKKADPRGWNVFADDVQLSPTSGNNVPKYYNDVEYQLPESTDGTDSVTVKFTSTNGTHLYYIIVGEGDEPEVEEAKKIGYVHNAADDPESTIAGIYLGGNSNIQVTNISAASSDVTLDSLQAFDALVIDNNVPADAALVPTLKSAVAYEPIVNLDSKLYEAWGYGSEVAGSGTDVTITDNSATLFSNWDGFDTEATTLTLLTEGNITGVSLGDYFAADDTLATIGDAVAIHQHNKKRNTYIFLPYTNVDLSVAAEQDNFSALLTAAVKTAADTKVDVIQTTKPSFTETYADKSTTVAIKGQTGATIHYTTDGTDPTTASPVYTEPLTETEAVTIKALATLDGYLNSDIATLTVTIKNQAKTPTISVAQEDGKSTITLAQADGVSIYYNFTGSNEQTASQVYTAPIELTEKATITAFAAGGDFVQSESASQLVEIQGQTEDNVRTYLLTNGHYNTANWYDGSKAVYPFSWGKSAQSIYSDAETQTLNDYEEIGSDSLGWKVISRGQVVTFENTTAGTIIGDGTGYNPETALDALAVETSNGFGNVEITKCETTLGAKAEGEPYTAAVQSTQAYKGPFDVVTFCYNGNGSNAPEIAVLVSTDGENFTMLGDTLVMDQARRLYRRSVVSYDGTDKVYVRVAHVGGGTKAMLSDVYVLGTKANEDVASGISNVITDNAESANAKVVAVYSINGSRLGAMQPGINIVKYSDGSVRKVLVK